MREFRSKVAVVTGAASGIGRSLAESFAAEGMKVVLADVERDPLEVVARQLRERGAEVLAHPTDVSNAQQMEDLANATSDHFGTAHLLCNNAGVFCGGTSWEAPIEDYQWLIGVNLWGVIHGVRAFVPMMIANGEPGHIVNTASMAALTSMPFVSIYHLTKHAVLAYSECLYHELRMKGTQLGVSTLCPEVVMTGIGSGSRNRPASLAAPHAPSAEQEQVEDTLSAQVKRGVSPDQMAARVLSGIREDRFYLLAEDAWREACDARLDDIRNARNPTFRVPAGAAEMS
jgi:NAD(P)-dependent dehydrogenase (short-subunit alcohol dehydrogenase family)